MSQALPYRPDIDTLRVAAVLSVIVFHIEKNWLPGGFLGVDIFFVISGFLMTAILLREMSGGGGGFP
ncbi:TPA: acyltransferase family protein [Neisseria meningitidis]|uniref:acyltransferase family protein n=1 Tax=Neisseria meningitidis TaxID=487 RepID=UPI000C330BE7|nr:acyltransferase [Neisseria meningitidis]